MGAAPDVLVEGMVAFNAAPDADCRAWNEACIPALLTHGLA
jgi:hypothetical protein